MLAVCGVDLDEDHAIDDDRGRPFVIVDRQVRLVEKRHILHPVEGNRPGIVKMHMSVDDRKFGHGSTPPLEIQRLRP